jgi:hypothetical protein
MDNMEEKERSSVVLLAIFGIGRMCAIPIGMSMEVVGRAISECYGYCEVVSVVGRYGNQRKSGMIGSGKICELSEILMPSYFYIGVKMEPNYEIWSIVNEEFMNGLIKGWRERVYKNNVEMGRIIDKVEKEMGEIMREAIVREIIV